MSYESYLEAAGKRVWLVDNFWHWVAARWPARWPLTRPAISSLQDPVGNEPRPTQDANVRVKEK
jgi:hypothetical protein